MKIFDARYFDIKSTLECGQLFRFDKLCKDDYILYSLDKVCRLTKQGDSVKIDSSDQRYFDNYFDLATDYESINDQLKEFDELGKAAAHGRGIRILRQDLLETIISFIISANNNIPRIKGIIERLCKAHGQKMDGYFAFPELEKLKDISKEEFRQLGAGFRDKYLFGTAHTLEKNVLTSFRSSDNDSAFKMLCSLSGVGAKVADCIMLFGLHRLDRFPVDVWMLRALKTEELNSPQKVSIYYKARYGAYAGLAQQYIFYHARESGTQQKTQVKE